MDCWSGSKPRRFWSSDEPQVVSTSKALPDDVDFCRFSACTPWTFALVGMVCYHFLFVCFFFPFSAVYYPVLCFFFSCFFAYFYLFLKPNHQHYNHNNEEPPAAADASWGALEREAVLPVEVAKRLENQLQALGPGFGVCYKKSRSLNTHSKENMVFVGFYEVFLWFL